MINCISDLQKYLIDLSYKFGGPREASDLILSTPGCSKEEIKELKSVFPGIPESYIKLLEAVNLNGISIGWLRVSPFSFNPEGMVANLIEGNEEGVLFSEYASQYHLYSVATTDGFGIFVATASSPFKEGEIILIDESIYADRDNPEKWIHKLAKDFEQFLIIAGNINQIHRTIKNEDEREQELSNRLKKLGIAEEYQQAWFHLFY